MPQDIGTEGPVTKVNIGRLTNSIFVFTLLLLFTKIRIPAFGDVIERVSPHVFGLLQLPDILSFLTAYLIIGMIWILAFHVFHMVARIDRTYLYLHIAVLMLLIMIPVWCHYTVFFPNKSFFSVLFHCIMLLLGLFLFFEWVHITRTPAVMRPGVFGWQMDCITLKMIFLPVTAVAGIILAACDLPYTQYIYYITMGAFALTSLFSWRNLKASGGSCRIDSGIVKETECSNHSPDSICKGIVPQDMFEIMMNGVFAFIMTLIIRNNIPLPKLSGSDDLTLLTEYMGDGVLGDLVTFVFLFIIFAILYILFFEMLRYIRALDRYFVYVSFIFVLALIFMPLTSLLYSISDMPVPYGILFHANVLISGLIMIILWKHASGSGRLIYPGVGAARVNNISLRLLFFPITAVAGLLIDSQVSSFGLIPETILYLIPCIAFFLLSRND